ncbi:MAG: tyrosine--tRNA ligase [Firmicutes bacterium]|nr:tyrosine--tRNA ligase [Bacillota bacterium]
MTNVYDILAERGYVEQCTDEAAVRELLEKERVTFYIGFDPTADSLHVGHFIQIMVMMHMQKAGHRPIALFGGGTGMVGDPSGRTDMRKVLTKETVDANVASFIKQMSRFIDFSDDKAIQVDNGDWLLELNYVDFLREIGRHFSVNRMLTAECYKSRLERGLTFLEFNYMLMQSYDFLELFRRYGAMLQMGGNDQWSNILSGADLIRRVEGAPAHALTFSLLTNSAGKKMGKTEAGAVWLDPEKTSPYDFYQYWRNIDDADVKKCLSLLTFIPMDEVNAMTDMEAGANINDAKRRLAWEITALVHGKDEADKAEAAAKALFGGGGDLANMPTTTISAEQFGEGMDVISLFMACELVKTRSEGRRLIQEGGCYVNNERITDFNQVIDATAFAEGHALLRKGKKVYHKAVIG